MCVFVRLYCEYCTHISTHASSAMYVRSHIQDALMKCAHRSMNAITHTCRTLHHVMVECTTKYVHN
jgi:hypothetical protein